MCLCLCVCVESFLRMPPKYYNFKTLFFSSKLSATYHCLVYYQFLGKTLFLACDVPVDDCGKSLCFLFLEVNIRHKILLGTQKLFIEWTKNWWIFLINEHCSEISLFKLEMYYNRYYTTKAQLLWIFMNWIFSRT